MEKGLFAGEQLAYNLSFQGDFASQPAAWGGVGLNSETLKGLLNHMNQPGV